MSIPLSIIEKLQLKPHPEGGFYREMYRSPFQVGVPDNEGKTEGRDLVTLIYFMLIQNTYSKFHRIRFDEIWIHQGGGSFKIHTLQPDGKHEVHLLGANLHAGEQLQVLIPGNTIFGAELANQCEYGLASCLVSPGFDFRDFELFDAVQMIAQFPEHASIINRLYNL